MFSLPNLVSSAIERVDPWTFRGEIPPAARKDKAERERWMLNRNTKHNVYTLIEGLNENRRVSFPSENDEGNPPHKLHGFVGDYDSPIPDSDLLKALEKFPFAPRHVERTLSGNLRLVWLFEEPMLVPSAAFLKFFLKQVLDDFPADRLLPGFDKPAWEDQTRYYTNSCEWKEIETAKPIPAGRVRGWGVKHGAKFSWAKDAGAVEIPFDVLRKALSEKYPRFSDWPGDFDLGEQGPSFWLPDSTSLKSAIVRETGIQTFAAHATKGFYTWADLLGNAFVKDYQADALGRAVDGIYHDGKHYYRRLVAGMWKPFEKQDLKEHLTIARGVSCKRDKSGVSDLDRALQHIQEHQSVVGCGPFIFHPPGPTTVNGHRVLNTYTGSVLTPADGPAEWGPGGRFPWLSDFLDGFFDPAEQKDFFLSWLSYLYQSGYLMRPRSGQNLFIAGAPNVGKTFLNQAVIAKLVGGSAEAQEVLLGRDAFGSELFEVPLWTIDDAVFSSSNWSQRRFSESLKKMAANRTFRCHAKFRVPLKVDWQGRIVVTCNRDEESVRAIPDLTGSILDKLMLFKTADVPAVRFREQEAMAKLLKAELPWFARFLLSYQIPEHCAGDVRFGVKPYHDPDLVICAEQSSHSNSFLQIMEDWMADYFQIREPRADYWEGTAYQLQKAILLDPTALNAMRDYNVDAISRQLSILKNKGYPIECDGHSAARQWRISRKSLLQIDSESTQ